MEADDRLATLTAALVPRYRVEREIGHGGMAWVYLAWDEVNARPVALKVLRSELAAEVGADRFRREIEIAGALQHPHILPLYESGQAGSLLYFTMPFVEGETLRTRLQRECQLPFDEAVQITREVAEALGYAHARGIVHRDIKPENIMLSSGHAIVTDFGIARAVEAAGAKRLTSTGVAIGTPPYMSPEQSTGDSHIDGRADLYSLGCVLYEMLAGEPPFTGPTVQAVIARHLHERPPSLRVVRPTVPDAVLEAIEVALAKVPADRFTTAAKFSAALADGVASRRRLRPRTRRALGMAAGTLMLVLLAVAAWKWLGPSGAGLDRNQVMVFPLVDLSDRTGLGAAGEEVATYVGYVLEGTDPLKWEEGRDWLSPTQIADIGALTVTDKVAISRTRGARYLIDGSILRRADSVTVVLRLFDASTEAMIDRAGSSGPPEASVARLGAVAVTRLLAPLLEPGRSVDVGALSLRSPAAIAHFHQGNVAYRQTHFAVALDHYHAAIEADSQFAFAAVKGAQAASWLENERPQDAARLIQVAVATDSLLPPRYAHFVHGLRLYLEGAADSAVARLRDALRPDAGWSEAWMALGEVYYHLMPSAEGLDSLAEAAFLESRRLDPDFSPPLFHLAEFALRRGDIDRGEQLVAALRTATPDSAIARQLDVMLRCLRSGAERLDWPALAAATPDEVLSAGVALAAGMAQPACAEAALRSALVAPTVRSRWGALLTLYNLLMGQGRTEDAAALLASDAAAGLPVRSLALIGAAAGAVPPDEAARLAREFGDEYGSIGTPNLWLLGEWEARNGREAPLAAVLQVVRQRADSTGSRRDAVIAAGLAARLTLLRGDSTDARLMLEALRPSATVAGLLWQPWEALVPERLALAQLYAAQRRFREALVVAQTFDSHRAVMHLIYLPHSLQVRAHAAEAMGDGALAAAYRSRLAALHTPASSTHSP
jgi:eukaryotic-like serine/threonine-protein kinase